MLYRLYEGVIKRFQTYRWYQLIKAADAVFSSLSQQEFYKSAKSVGCYLSMSKGELQTDRIIQDLLSRGVYSSRHF